jgi:hypothetical protein
MNPAIVHIVTTVEATIFTCSKLPIISVHEGSKQYFPALEILWETSGLLNNLGHQIASKNLEISTSKILSSFGRFVQGSQHTSPLLHFKKPEENRRNFCS